MSKLSRRATVVAALIAITMIAWALYSFTRMKQRVASSAGGVEAPSGIMTFPNGELEPDVAGSFGGPELRTARASYRRNLSLYAQFDYAAFDPKSKSSFLQLLRRHATPIFQLAPETSASLTDHWFGILRLLSNHDTGMYLSSLSPHRRPTPLSDAQLQDPYISGRYTRALTKSRTGTFDDSAAAAFIVETDWQPGSQLVAVANDSRGWACNVRRITNSDQRVDLLSDVVPLDRRESLFGMLSQSSYRVFGPPLDVAEQFKRDGSVLFAELALVIKTRDKDAYPLQVLSLYDPVTKTWWLSRASRQSSIRAANYYSMVF